jgi:hypothetical protein
MLSPAAYFGDEIEQMVDDNERHAPHLVKDVTRQVDIHLYRLVLHVI